MELSSNGKHVKEKIAIAELRKDISFVKDIVERIEATVDKFGERWSQHVRSHERERETLRIYCKEMFAPKRDFDRLINNDFKHLELEVKELRKEIKAVNKNIFVGASLLVAAEVLLQILSRIFNF